MYPTRVADRTSVAAPDDAERQAIERVLTGERSAFRLLVERHQRGVFNVIVRLTHSPADAEDLTQQAFLHAFDSLGDFQLDLKFSSWIYRIAVNLAKDHLKSRRRGELPSGDELDGAALFAGELPAVDGSAISSERRALLARGLASLSVADREVLVLKDIEELPYEEIRSILRRPITALKIRVVRARARLRTALDKLAGEGAL
jgi:RNA polymerase sigma-70 factor (ECF subfamily)